MANDRIHVNPSSERWAKRLPASAAVRVGDLLFVSGQASTDDAGKPLHAGDPAKQLQTAFARVRKVLKAAGADLGDVLDVMTFHKDPRTIDQAMRYGHKVFKAPFPAWTAAGMVGTYRPELEVIVRVIAHLGKGQKRGITPATVGWMKGLPMSAACKKGGYVFTSGLLAAKADGGVVAPADHMAQARFCYDHLKQIMAQAGGSLDDIVDMIAFNHDARGMDASVDTWCNETIPGVAVKECSAYTAIAVTGLHRMGQVGCYRAVADLSESPRVATNLPSVHWYKQRIAGASKKRDGRLIGIAGQVASDGDQNIIARGDVASQAHYCFSQIRGVLEKHGAGLENVVDIVSFHKDPRAWETVMAVGRELFKPGHYPAWTPVGCTGLYLEGYLHEIYAVAMV